MGCLFMCELFREFVFVLFDFVSLVYVCQVVSFICVMVL